MTLEEMKSTTEIVLIILTPFGIVAWAVIRFFTSRIVNSLDANSLGLKEHSDKLNDFTLKLQELNSTFQTSKTQTSNELGTVSDRVDHVEREVDSLRKDRHSHGNMLTKHQLFMELSQEKFHELDAAVKELTQSQLRAGGKP